MVYLGIFLVAVAFAIVLSIRAVTIFEYERGLRYQSGRFTGVVNPGTYWIAQRFTRIVRVDIRPNLLSVPGQEVIAADGVGLKITIAAMYKIIDPAQAAHSISNYRDALYTLIQLAARELIAGRPAESILTDRAAINARLMELTAPRAAEFGVEIVEVQVKDVMFPGDLKKVFSQVVRARQEGLAALERARGETAALRNLANAAAMLEQRPALMQLRILQALGQDGGNTVVIGLGSQAEIVPVPPRKPQMVDDVPAADE